MMDSKLMTLYFVNFAVTSIYTAIIPFYPIIASQKGVSFLVIGAIVSTMPLVTFLTSPIFGRSLEKLGRHCVLMTSVFLAATSLVVASVSLFCDTVPFIVLGFVFRVIAGVALSMNSTAAYSILSSDYSVNFQRLIGLMEMSTGLGIIIGPVMTAALYIFFGAFWSFMGMAFIIYAALVPAFLMLGRERPYIKIPSNRELLPGMLTNPVILADLLVLFLELLGIGFLDLVLTSYLVSLGCSTELAAGIYIISCITYTAFSPVVSYLPASIDKRSILTGGLLISLLAYYLCGTVPPLPPSIWVVAAGVALQGTGAAMIQVSVLPHILRHCTDNLGMPHDDILSDKISMYATAFNGLGMVAGPIMCGLLLEVLSLQETMWVLAGLFLVFTVLYVVLSEYWRHLFCRVKNTSTDLLLDTLA
jgi:MFS family permease